MNQLALSTDLTVITAEINSFKQVAGQAVFEIGKRLKHVKENDLVHGQWEQWLESVDITIRTAQRMIQAFEQFGNTTTSSHLETSKIFEMLSLPESVDRAAFIEQPHIIPSNGELKQVEDMTVKQLREVTKQLKQSEAKYNLAINQYSEQQDKLLSQIDELKKSKTKDSPETLQRIEYLEKEVEGKQRLNNDNVRLHKEMQELRQVFIDKTTKRDEEIYATRELNRSLRNIINVITSEHINTKQLYKTVVAHRSAHESIQGFVKLLGPLIQDVFDTWKEVCDIPLEEVKEIDTANGTD